MEHPDDDVGGRIAKLIREAVWAYAALHSAAMVAAYYAYVSGKSGLTIILWIDFGGFFVVLITTYLQCRRAWRREPENPVFDYSVPALAIIATCFVAERVLKALLA